MSQKRLERLTMLKYRDLAIIEEDMSAMTFYRLEVSRLPDITKLSDEQRQRLVTRARACEEQARVDLLLCCLGYVLRRAAMGREERPPTPEQMLDFAQEGNLAMVEVLEKALASDRPIVCLCQSAQRAIVRPARSKARLQPKSDKQTIKQEGRGRRGGAWSAARSRTSKKEDRS